MTLSPSARRTPPRSSGSSDWLWGGFGVTIASVSASFAAYMIATAPAEVTGSGSKEFGIFARWDRRVPSAVADGDDRPTRRPPGLAPVQTAAAPAIDPEPTGSIGAVTPARRDDRPTTARPAGTLDLGDFVLRSVVGGSALIEHRDTLTFVKPGSKLDGAGEVLAIERRGDRWVVKTAGGIIGGS